MTLSPLVVAILLLLAALGGGAFVGWHAYDEGFRAGRDASIQILVGGAGRAGGDVTLECAPPAPRTVAAP